MTDELTPGMEKVIDQIRKLLAHSAGTQNPEEQASYANKAQELLTRYNLDAALIEQAQGRVDGRREEAKMDGGFYLYQRSLYSAIAELNFCMYFTENYWAVRDKRIVRRGRVYDKGAEVLRKRHRIIGRQVNTAATKVMAEYLEQAIERHVREELRGDTTYLWANWGISFREGAVQTLTEKIGERRKQKLREERAKAHAEARAKTAGASTAKTLTLNDYVKNEEQANYDFVYGEGSWARELEEDAKRAARWEAEYARRAKLAKDDPEAYAAEEKERRKNARRWGRERAPKERDKDWSAYRTGSEKARHISIDPQMGSRTAGLLT